MDITIYVQDDSGERHPLTLPTDMSLSLMEGLKAGEFPVLGTCGGMALCASCHIEVLEGQVPNEPQDAEWSMLDTVPVLTDRSRLACQIPLTDELDGLVVRIIGS
jgi:2Fe-2S ferredoxin